MAVMGALVMVLGLSSGGRAVLGSMVAGPAAAEVSLAAHRPVDCVVEDGFVPVAFEIHSEQSADVRWEVRVGERSDPVDAGLVTVGADGQQRATVRRTVPAPEQERFDLVVSLPQQDRELIWHCAPEGVR